MHAVGPRGGTIYTEYMPRTYISGYCRDFWAFPKKLKVLYSFLKKKRRNLHPSDLPDVVVIRIGANIRYELGFKSTVGSL